MEKNLVLVLPNFSKEDIKKMEDSETILNKIYKLIEISPEKRIFDEKFSPFNPLEYLTPNG